MRTVNPHSEYHGVLGSNPGGRSVVKAQWAFSNSPSGLLPEKGIKIIMKNKEKIN